MSVLKTILQIIGGFTGLYLAGMMIYQLILGFFGFGKIEGLGLVAGI